ncbi:MAG TPA: trypsin-like peptidase domain-containing protein [Pseudonocardia sp.]|nr:trypsin-like peptidase domain-containing protein [Pseudonocardia sp.]
MRVLSGDGTVIGAGFVIGPDLVATCAHVVADAAAADPYAPDPPHGTVLLDFPLVPGGGPGRARVHRWSPIAADGSGDIAVLRLDRPAPHGARMPPLRRVDALWGHGFRVLGFPDGLADGVWSTGRIRGEQGTRWFQLQGAPGDQAVVGGFSGSPVWDEETGAVVGMTVAADRSTATTTAYLIPIDQVLGLDPELLPCPYRGLEPFGEEHAAFFFGRDPELRRLREMVAGQPLVAVAGPSGVGKSSLVRAGLLPRERDSGTGIAEVRAAAAVAPAAALAAALAPLLQPPQAPAGLAARLASPERHVRTAAARALVPEPGVLVFVDQFEELAATEPDAARQLLLLLTELVGTDRADAAPMRAVLTVRWESLAELLTPDGAGPAVPVDSVLDAGSALVTGAVLVGPMDRGRLRAAVVGPAERAPGLSFEPGLVDRILDDAGSEPGQLPLVESLLTELWERRTGGSLTVAAYEAAGGVAGAVAKRAEELLAEFPDPGEQARLRRLLTLLAQPDRDGRFVRRPVPLAELAPDLRALVPRLVAGRLLVVQRVPDRGETLELAHQALIQHWPRLQRWLTDDRDFLAWRAQLDQQRERWEAADQDPGALLRGTALAAAGQWLPARAAEVSPADRDYLRRSRARQRRDVRRWRTVTAVLAVLVLAAGALAAVALERGNRLDARLRVANADSLVREAQLQAPTNPDLSVRLALAASRADPENAGARGLLAAHALGMRSVVGVHAGLTTAPIDAFGLNNTSGSLVLPAPDRGVVHVSGISGPDPQPWVIPDVAPGSVVRPSGDGSVLLVVGETGVRRWDVATRTATEIPVDLSGLDLTLVAASADARRIAWLTPPGPAGRELVVVDLATGRRVPHGLGPLPDPDLTTVALPADPSVVVLVSGPQSEPTGRVVRRLADGAELRRLADGATPVEGGYLVCEPAADPDGAGTAVLIDEVGAGEVRRFPLVRGDCRDLRVSVDRGHLIEKRLQVPGDVVPVRLTRLADGATFEADLPPGTEPGGDAARPQVSATGVLRTADGGAEVLRANGSTLLRIATTPAVEGTVGDAGRLSLTADGRHVVGDDEVGYLAFDRATGRLLTRIHGRDLPHPWETVSVVDGNELSLLVATPDGLVLDRLSVPGFAPVAAYDLPGEQLEGSTVRQRDGRLVALTGGHLTSWDSRTHELLGGPVRVDPGSRNPVVALRPQHPGEVALVGPELTIELWDADTGARTGVLPPEGGRRVLSYALTFDLTGERLVSHTQFNTIEVWDVDTHTLVRPPIPLPRVSMALGFTADGHYLTQSSAETGGNVITFWDLDSGREAGSVRLPAHDAGPISPDGARMALNGFGGALPVELPLTAAQWRDQLCTFADRPFSATERDALPAGFDPGSPCS